MNLWFRLLGLLITALFRPPLALTEPSVLRFRVLPHDLDLNMHMTNSRYLSFMDLGRVDLIARNGIWRPMLRRRWRAVVGGAFVRFRRPLGPFRTFTLKSRAIGWDTKWIYMEQRLEEAGSLACPAVVRTTFIGASGVVVPPVEVVRQAGFAGAPLEPPAFASQWEEMEKAVNSPRAAAPKQEKPVV